MKTETHNAEPQASKAAQHTKHFGPGNLRLSVILILARKHLGGDMESSARSCLADAVRLEAVGDYVTAAKCGLKSLAYSVGICSEIYSRAFNASGFEGEVRIV